MITNHILEDKWRVQRALSEQADHDPSRYIALVHKKAVEAQERYGIHFRYVEMEAKPYKEPLPQDSRAVAWRAVEHSPAADTCRRR